MTLVQIGAVAGETPIALHAPRTAVQTNERKDFVDDVGRIVSIAVDPNVKELVHLVAWLEDASRYYSLFSNSVKVMDGSIAVQQGYGLARVYKNTNPDGTYRWCADSAVLFDAGSFLSVFMSWGASADEGQPQASDLQDFRDLVASFSAE